MTLDELINQIKSSDEKTRTPAWQHAGQVGAPAVQPLAAIVVDSPDAEIARSATHALWKIVRDAGRPGAEEQRTAVMAAFLSLIKEQTNPAARRPFMWMLSEVADATAVPPVSSLLSDAELREDARMVLQRIPGDASIAALRKALDNAPSDFQPALADALRHRGIDVPNAKSDRLKPVKPTGVKPVGR